ARAKAAEGERRILGEEQGQRVILLPKLAAPRELVGIDDAIDVARAHGDDEHRAGWVRVGAAGHRRIARSLALTSERRRSAAPQIGRSCGRVAIAPRRLELTVA